MGNSVGFVLRPVGRRLARYLAMPRDIDVHPATSPGELVAAALRPGDVLLVEGTSRFSAAIKYLTQSTWSHAALYVGDVIDPPGFIGERRTLIEADVNEGCGPCRSAPIPVITRASAARWAWLRPTSGASATT